MIFSELENDTSLAKMAEIGILRLSYVILPV
jgi:hypothetical protein